MRYPLMAFAVVSLFATSATATPPRVERGQKKYIQYCAACHGPAAKGDGVLAEALKIPPPNLTTIAARNGGFDAKAVTEYIDGRRSVRSHGTSQMPVWGQRFVEESKGRRDSSKEAAVDRNLSALVAYLASIQVPATPGP